MRYTVITWHSVSFAQNYFENYLPEGAVARFGKGYIFDFDYSPDGTLLAVGSTIGIWIYDAHTGEEVKLLTGHTYYVNSVAFSPDGKTIASGGGDYTIKLWDVSTGQAKVTLKEHTDDVYSVAFSPDGKTLASCGENIYLWDVHTGKLMKTFIGNLDGTYFLAFSPDGRTLASGGRDSTVILWDLTK